VVGVPAYQSGNAKIPATTSQVDENVCHAFKEGDNGCTAISAQPKEAMIAVNEDWRT
jgi:hypothetical protein